MSLGEYLRGGPTFLHQFSRTAGVLSVLAAVLFAIELDFPNALIWTASATTFLAISSRSFKANIIFYVVASLVCYVMFVWAMLRYGP